ncbi:hypothetical protein B0H13DRAFT_2383419 [Mycena leptocephala]|nr:hypothetical protein B0H13DRAFT_2383419 [Mycena leptocephala]
MADGDSDMSTPWEDDENWIQDRLTRAEWYERGASGYWTGDSNTPTWVYPLGASLSTPPPPFRGFNTPRNRGVSHRPEHSGTGRRTTDTASTSGSGSEYLGTPQYREEMLHHHALSSRSRFRDEPAWGGRRPRYDPRNARPDYDNRDILDRDRFRERERDRDRELEFYHEERMLRKSRTPRIKTRTPRREETPADVGPPRLFPSLNPRLASRGPDGHPQAPTTVTRVAEGFMAPAPDPDYATHEEERITRSVAATRKVESRLVTPSDFESTQKTGKEKGKEVATGARIRDERLGMWQFLSIANLHQAYNLVEWLNQGEDSAYELFLLVVQNASADPSAFRTEGEAHIIMNQQDLERRWWITTRGVARASPRFGTSPTVRTAPGVGPASHLRPAQHNPMGNAWSFGTTVPITPSPSTTALPFAGGYSADARGYLSSSPPDPVDMAPPLAPTGDFRAWRHLPNTLGTVVKVG